MRGAIPPLPQYVFMAWCLVSTGTTLLNLMFYSLLLLKTEIYKTITLPVLQNVKHGLSH
jgi:hypothetical protein